MNFLKLCMLAALIASCVSCYQKPKSTKNNLPEISSNQDRKELSSSEFEYIRTQFPKLSSLDTYEDNFDPTKEEYEDALGIISTVLDQVPEDSLSILLNYFDNNFNSPVLLTAIGDAVYNIDLDYGESILNRAIQKSTELNDLTSLERAYRKLGRIEILKLNHSTATAHFQKSLKLAEQKGSKDVVATTLLLMVSNFVNDFKKDEAYYYIQRAETIIRDIEDNDQLLVEYYTHLGLILSLEGRYKEALLMEDSINYIYPGYSREASKFNRGVLHNYQGYYRKSSVLISEVNEQSIKNGYQVEVGYNYLILADNYEHLGVYDTAMLYNKQALDIFNENEIQDLVCQVKSQISSIQYKTGNEYASSTGLDAIKCYDEVIASGDNYQLYQNQLWKSQYYEFKGDTDKALSHTDSCLLIVTELNIPGLVAGTYIAQGNLLRQKGNLEQANKKFQSALEQSLEEGSYSLVSECYLRLAEIKLDLADYEEALTYATRSFNLAEELEFVFIFEDILNVLIDVRLKREEFKEAYEYQAMLTEFKDKLRNFTSTDLLSYYSNKLNLEKYQETQTELQKINANNQSLLNKNRKNIAFLIVAFILLVVLFLIYAYYSSKKIKNELRREIARDIHDDLGALLYKIALNAHNLINNGEEEESSKSTTENIARLSQTAMLSLKNILWRTNVDPITFAEYEKILRHFNDLIFGQKLESKNVEFKVIGIEKNRFVDNEFAFHSFKIYKELVQNVIKNTDFEKDYKIKIQWLFSAKELQLYVANSIHKSKVGAVSSSMGLGNLKKRLEVLNGSMDNKSSDQFYESFISIPIN